MLKSLLSIGSDIIDRVLPDKEARREAKARLIELQQQGELTELEARMSAIETEATSTDRYVKRARPTFMYVFYFVILALVVVAPLVGVFAPDHMAAFFQNVGAGFDAVPQEMWYVFATGYLGYGGFRTFEKIRGSAT